MEAAPAPTKKVLVIGGSGRVGGSTARYIHKLAAFEGQPVELSIGGRSEANKDASLARIWAKLAADTDIRPGEPVDRQPAMSFTQVDISSEQSVRAAVLDESRTNARAQAGV